MFKAHTLLVPTTNEKCQLPVDVACEGDTVVTEVPAAVVVDELYHCLGTTRKCSTSSTEVTNVGKLTPWLMKPAPAACKTKFLKLGMT